MAETITGVQSTASDERESIQSLGGKARAAALSPEQRSQIASDAAKVRWLKPGATKPRAIEALIAKFPDFDPKWDERMKATWFESFQKLVAMLSERFMKSQTKVRLFDVVAVDLQTNKVRVIATGKTRENAEAVVKMAVMRRGVDEEFFTEVRAGAYKEGDTYKTK